MMWFTLDSKQGRDDYQSGKDAAGSSDIIVVSPPCLADGEPDDYKNIAIPSHYET